MKRLTAVFMFLCVGFLAAYAADYSILQTVFIPPRYYVGDHVELRIRLKVASGVRVAVPETMPEASWILFRDAGVSDRGDEKEIRIVFTPFYPGTQTLPVLKFGDITLRDLKINTDSLLTGIRDEYRPPLGQVLLPGTRLYFAVLALAVIGGTVFSVVLFRFVRKRLKTFREAWHGRVPYRRMKKVMRNLNRDLAKLDERTFYIILLDEMRIYISGKTMEDCRSATTREIRMHLDRHFSQVTAALREDLLGLFRRGDLVKFSHARTDREEKKASLERLRLILAEFEKNRREKEPTHVDA